MPKTKTPQASPADERIASLRVLGVTVEPMTSRRGYFKVCSSGHPQPLRGTSPVGYGSRDAAIRVAETLVRKLRQYRADADEALAEYVGVANTMMDAGYWRTQYNAACEYERTEAVRIGVPPRRNAIRGVR